MSSMIGITENEIEKVHTAVCVAILSICYLNDPLLIRPDAADIRGGWGGVIRQDPTINELDHIVLVLGATKSRSSFDSIMVIIVCFQIITIQAPLNLVFAEYLNEKAGHSSPL